MAVHKILNYKLLFELGQGGMASVWYAENSVGRAYAIKLLKPELVVQEPSVVDRFRNEAQIMVKLNHPGIRRVEDYYEDGSTLAIIMEYLEGQDLQQYMRKYGRIPEEQVVSWFRSILEAFNYVHQKGYFHRDVKPANLFVTRDGQVKVMDFGIAKIVGNDLGLTQTNSMMGSPLYMSPEQILEPKLVDYRTDIYSLGVALYTLLAGAKPYDDQQKSSFSIQSAIVQNSLPNLQHISEFLNVAIAKATEKRPENRFVSCADFAQALTIPSFVSEDATELIQVSNRDIQRPTSQTIPDLPQKPTSSEPQKLLDLGVSKDSKGAWYQSKLLIGIVVILILSSAGIYAAFFNVKKVTPNKLFSEQDSSNQTRMVDQPNDQEKIDLAISYYKTEQYDSAFVLFNRYADKPAFRTNAEAITDLGIIYYFGGSLTDNVQPDLVKAEQWLGKGAALNNPKAHYYLGLLNDGVDFRKVFQAQGKNVQAIGHYQEAAQGGDSYAQVTLAELYMKKNLLLQKQSPCILLSYLDKAVLDESNETAKVVRSEFQKKKLCP